MPFYECVFIARQDISSSQAEGLVEQFSGIIKDNGGTVAKTEMWGLRNLAYRIKKNRKGHYAMLNIDAPPAAVKEMERNMGLNEDVLRYLTLRVNKLEEGPSIVIMAKQSREDRGRGGGRGERGHRGDRGDRGHRGERGERGEHRGRSGGEDAARSGDRDEKPSSEKKSAASEETSP